ncbi:MAG: hypothetical protein IJD92_01925 [Bacilli bacterium]|nr:hypothetical protein [Bacilli bacterium]
MGIFDKIKGILFDEEEVELPEIKKEPEKVVKKENIRIEEDENPIKEIKIPKDDFSDREHKTESTFTFPIDFDDEEFERPVREEKPRPRIEETIEKKQPLKRDYTDFLNKKDVKKQFKPTPIISPVYGVLDQNYKKEDVIVKKDVLRRPNEITLDEVRKKAFGTLEDEIELNMPSNEEKTIIKEEIKKEIIVEEPVDKLKTIGELIEEDSLKIDVPKLESIIDEEEQHNNKEDEEEITIEEPKNTFEDLIKEDIIDDVEEEIIEEEIIEDEVKEIEEDEIDEDEADLFSLIDSMYEEKGE